MNRIHQRALSILLSLALVFGIFAIDTVGASAASGDGRTTLMLDSNITITDSGSYVITQQDSGTPNTHTITVDSGMAPDIELENVNIDVHGTDDKCAFSIAPGASVTLTLTGTNTLVSGGTCAGLRVPAGTPSGVSDASLTITEQSTGSLNVTGAGTSNDDTQIYVGGAGIGGNNNESGGKITINGGTVAAQGGENGAGIGGGSGASSYNPDDGTFVTNGGDGGNISISGGTVMAQGGEGGAGIGGGLSGNGTSANGSISITGGAVAATGGDSGAGIGGGNVGKGTADGGKISISGGTVTANGGMNGAGIGGGGAGNGTGDCNGNGDGSEISVSGGTVAATGGAYGAGIGGGSDGNGTGTSGKITVSGGTVTATGGSFGAGIGGGCNGSGTSTSGSVQIKGADTEVTAQEGGGHDIGSGYNYNASSLSGGNLAVSDCATVAMLSVGTDARTSYTGGSRILTVGNSGQIETVYVDGSNPGSRTVLTTALTAETDANGGLRLTAKATDGSGAAISRGSFTFTDSCVLNAQEATHTESAIINGSNGTASYDFDGLSSHGVTVLTAKYHDPNDADDALKVVFYYNPEEIDLSSIRSGGYCYTYDPITDTDYGSNPGAVTLTKNGWYTFTGSTMTNKIEVTKGISACITLDHVSIDVSGSDSRCAFSLDQDATANLTLKNNNMLISGGDCAGLRVPGSMDYDTLDASLTITAQSTGSLNAIGAGYPFIGCYFGGAGIGGNSHEPGGKITVNGGTVTAVGGDYSAGIGGGDSYEGGTVYIGGSAEVHAKGQGGGHDIGSGGLDGSVQYGDGHIPGGGTLSVAGTDLGHGPQVELQSKGIDASAPDGTHQFTNCKIWGPSAKDAGNHDISGCYDGNGKIRLSAVLSAVPTASTVFGSPVKLTASNIARVGFNTTPTLSGTLSFLYDQNTIQPPAFLTSGTASVNWTPTDAAEHQLTVQYQNAEGEAYAIHPEDIVPYPATYSAGKATPTVTAAPTAANAPYDSKLADVSLSGGSAKNSSSGAEILGRFTWAQPDTVIKDSGPYYAVFSPDNTTDYNTVSTISVPVNVIKATPTVTTPPTASRIPSGSKLSTATFTGGTVTDASGTMVQGAFTWAQPDTVVAASGNYDAIFTPTDGTDYNTTSVSVNVTVTTYSSDNSNSSTTSTLPLPSGVTDAVSNAQADLSGATMPSGVTSVTLSVIPEAVTPTAGTTNTIPTAPGVAGGTTDPQAAAILHLAVSDPGLDIIGTPVLYNIKLLDQNGNPITGFSGKVTVRIPLPAGMHGVPHVFRFEESTGTLTDMNAVVENGFLVFSTEHFSYYTVAGVGDSITLDTKGYQMPVSGKYQIGLKLTGSKAASVKVTSTNGKVASAVRLKSGNVQVTGKGTGTAYIMIDVYDSKNHLLTHASVRIDVKTGIRPRGDSTRQIGVF